MTVADNSTMTFRATATDGFGNTSPCSSSSVTYVESSGGGPDPDTEVLRPKLSGKKKQRQAASGSRSRLAPGNR